jgi:ABC-type protease/lipase transport system fused ATPase/permease subunit
MVAVITHRPSMLEACDLVLYVADGAQKAFGRRDDVLPRILGQAQRPQVVRSSPPETGLAVAG